MRSPLARSRDSLLLREYVQQLNYGWAYGHENQRGHYKQDQGNDHFDGGLGGLFFGALAALGAQGIGMDAQGLGDAGSEAVGLNQGPDQGADVIDAGALGQIAERLDARFAGTSFEVEEMEFGAQFGMRRAQIFADAHHGLIERQAGFHADDGQIQSIGEAEANAVLSLLQFLFQQEARNKKAEGGQTEQQQGGIE